MSRKIQILAVALAVVAIAGTLYAQPQGGQQRGERGQRQAGGPGEGRGPGGGMMGGEFGAILGSPEAKAAVGLSDDQTKQIETVIQEAGEQVRALFQNGPPDRAQMEKIRAESAAKVEKVMNPEQLKKAKTLAFQSMGGLDGVQRAGGGPGRGFGGGFNASMSAFAMGSLDLTAEQQKALQDARGQMQEKMRELMQGAGGPPSREQFETLRPKVEALQAESKAAVDKILTADQKALATKLVAETPEFIKQAQSRRGGPEGQGGAGYRPGSDSWQPGQGGDAPRPRRQGGGFPQGE